MGEKTPANAIILGAGPSGLSAAWNLVQDGYQVTLLEKEAVTGGQSITFQRGDYKYDLGPHNIHSQHESIIRFLKKSLGDKFIQHEFSAQIYFRGKRINYPLMGIDVLQSINLHTAAHCVLSFLWRRFISFFQTKFKDDGNYRTWIVNRFGRKFYDIFFAPYSEKVWGIPPEQLSDIVAKKRIPVLGIIELIHSIVFKNQRYHPENPVTIENYYLSGGVGEISDFFRRGIVENGGEILTQCPVEKIVLDQLSVKKIYYSDNGTRRCIDFEKAGGVSNWKVFSTIPVNEMIMMLDGKVPEEVTIAAENLDFTSEVFLYLNLKRSDLFKIPLLYFSESEFPFNRIYDIGIFSRKMVADGKNAICLEISCSRNDEIWKMDDDQLFEMCIECLEKHNLLKRTEVEDYHTRRLKHAYPRFRVGYEKKLQTIFEYIENINNFITFGREGLFAYANVDDAIWMGFEVAKNIKYQERMCISLRELLPPYISF